jgi:hypothetical protein
MRATTAAQPYELVLKVKRILMADLTTARAQAKGVAPTINREGEQRPALPLPRLARTWPQRPRSRIRYPHPFPTWWTSCTAS